MDNNILEMGHEQWLQHPITVMFNKALHNHRDVQINMAVGHSTAGEVNSDKLRYHLISAKNTEAILAMLNSPTILERIANPPKEL